ncbi:hypothetical protein [Streptacidiphilus jiangxiensis]|uniref:Uncharacterized protein n=1 Tax=Streptacidiphilus jiangxiensis TaxID=235985 RepID=A0A1H7PC13_STRJI|nr:hypothetical protein [Streptacidiphilus jiangxiensis]SEL33340.1 hypothetical protein SAMN05414137_107317 [Streptacidiphilus jiangxiensis]
MAADLLSRSRLYAERRQSGRRLRRRESDHLPGHLLRLIAARMTGDAAVLFRLDGARDEAPPDQLRAGLAWLHDHQFIALEGTVDAIARVWVNPAVAVRGGTDPRTAAARHHFPYISVADTGMAAEEPVTFHPYHPDLWEVVYEGNQETFDQSTFLDWQCPRHGQSSVYPRLVPDRE